MKTIKHFHWGWPGFGRLFAAGFWLALGATLGVSCGLDVARLIRNLGEMLAGFAA